MTDRFRPTGSARLDGALGLSGWPTGRLIEIYGPPQTGKKLLALRSVRAVQDHGGSAAWIDADGQFDMAAAERVGVDQSALLLAVPVTGEQALQLLADAVSSGLDLVVLASAPSAVPQQAQRRPFGDGDDLGQGRLWAHALRAITARAQATGTTMLVLNQVRHLPVEPNSPVYDWQRTAIGAPIAYYASVRVELGHAEEGFYFRITQDDFGPPGRTDWME